ncbi:MAG: hypothetical protein RR594_00440 [Clostridia bacterium]
MKIQLKRGLNSNISSTILSEAELAFVTDTNKLYIGNAGNKVLLNPLDKPNGLDTTTPYTKFTTNDYGQIVTQSYLLERDIPNLSSSKIQGLGTAAMRNVGVSTGEIPTVDGTLKLPISVIPRTIDTFFGYYVGSTISVSANSVIPLTNFTRTGGSVELNADGSATFVTAGIYLVTYSLTSNTQDASTALTGDKSSGYWSGSFCRNTSSGAAPYCSCSSMFVRTAVAGEKIMIRNIGTNSLSIPNNYCNMTIIKLY